MPVTTRKSPYYTRSQLAKIMRISERHVDRLIGRGEVPGEEIVGGRARRFRREIVDAWLRRRRA
jgi:excisionase family DNA binding protein